MEPHVLLAMDSDSRHSMKYFRPQTEAAKKRKKDPAAAKNKCTAAAKNKCTAAAAKRVEPPTPTLTLQGLIPKAEPGKIPLDPVDNYAPTAPRVQDAVQFPIESMFS
eukprot:jgi/Ulvmu1/5705/UM024_0054.1